MFIFSCVNAQVKVESDELGVPVLDLLFECVKILENLYLIKLSFQFSILQIVEGNFHC